MALIAEGRAVTIQAAQRSRPTKPPVQDAHEVGLHDPTIEAFTRLRDALNVIARLEQTNQQLVWEVASPRG